MSFFSHETAIIDPGASIGANTKIWHWSHVCDTAIIGSNCILGQNVYVANNVTIGNGVKIQNNVSVYEGVVLEDDVFCGPSAVFTNVYNPRAFIERKDEFKKTLVKKGATLGANCTIVCGVTIGEYAFVGAGSVINEDIPDFGLYVGVPGKQVGWISRYGDRMDIQLGKEGKYTCFKTGDCYELNDGVVFLKA